MKPKQKAQASLLPGKILPFEYRDLGELRSRSELRRDTKSEGIAALHRGEGTRTLFRRSENGSFWPINIAFFTSGML